MIEKNDDDDDDKMLAEYTFAWRIPIVIYIVWKCISNSANQSYQLFVLVVAYERVILYEVLSGLIFALHKLKS